VSSVRVEWEVCAMKIKFTRLFTDYRTADAWIEEHGYSESILDIADSGTVTVTLEGEHAKHAIEAATKAKVVSQRAAP
jgi:hypothetical protein